jgi:flagellar hook protein FlgE
MRIQGWSVPAGGSTVDTNQPIADIQISLDVTLAQATQNVQFGGNLSSTTPIAPAASNTVDSTFGVYDSLGTLHTVTVQFARTGANAWTWELLDPTALGITGSGTLTFDTEGHYLSSTMAALDPIHIPGSAGADDIDFTSVDNLDLASMTMLDAANGASARSQDGLPAGTVSDVYGAPNTGEVYLVYSNGLKQLIGQLALSHFTNPTGLLRAGQNLFKAGLNSGDPQIGAAGSGGRGWISSGYLEASNVDMAQEFTHMILAQRGFQASSRVITTADEILQELVNLKR